jgi:hypothetical protein
LCPSLQRGCFGCFGPSESANLDALRTAWAAAGISDDALYRALRTFNVGAPEFRDGAARLTAAAT